LVKVKEAKEVESEKMRVWKRKGPAIALLLFLFLLLYFLAVTTVASAVNAAVVSEVKGLGDYVPRNHSFTHGDTLKVYVEMRGVNHYGFVSVDFYFIIEDPKGHVVAMDTKKVERNNYRAWDDYVEYTKKIPDWWLYGKYKLGIYAYDRVDDTKTREAIQKIESGDSIEEQIESGKLASAKVVTKSLASSRKEERSIVFFVHPKGVIEKEKPPEITIRPSPEEVKRPIFTVTDVSIDRFKVMPGEPVSISVAVKNTGIRGTDKVTVVINGVKEAEETVTLGHMESKTLVFHVKRDMPGTYKVTIPGTDIVRLFFVEESESYGEEGTGAKTGSFTATSSTPAPKMSASGTGMLSVLTLPIHIFDVGIAFIAILTIIILLRFNFYRG